MPETGQAPGIQFYLELTIKDVKYNPVNIRYLIIREWIFNFLSTIELQIIDDGFLTEVYPLEDQEDIDIVLSKNEDDENPLRLTFSLDDYTVEIEGDNRKSVVTLIGHLKVNDMFLTKTRSFSRQNSSTVLSTIALENGLPFYNPHNIIPSDNMIWYQIGQSNFDFIKHVLKRSYVPNDVTFFYADISKRFIFTSLKSEIDKRDVKISKFSVENFELNVKDENDPNDTVWFSSYNIVNNSSYFNKRIGYGFGYGYYDLSNGEIFKEYSNINKFTRLSFRNNTLANNPVVYETFKDLNDSTVYSEYYYESLLRNEFLKNNFFANSLVLNINSLSQVKLMDKIDVNIPSLFEDNQSNEVMSGFYLVAGIQHEISNGGIYKKKLALGRNGMNKTPNVNIYKVES